jgi:hypothetical protein
MAQASTATPVASVEAVRGAIGEPVLGVCFGLLEPITGLKPGKISL